MSDSEQRQLHVPYREYNSQNNGQPTSIITGTTISTTTPAATTTNVEDLIDIATLPSASISLADGYDPPDLLPSVEFAPNCGDPLAIDSPGIDRESQPLLGRIEIDAAFNRFHGNNFKSFLIPLNELFRTVVLLLLSYVRQTMSHASLGSFIDWYIYTWRDFY